jgi:hypothetical protein
MTSTRTLLLTGGALGVLAAGLGGYVALRQNGDDRRAADRAAEAQVVPAADVSAVPAAEVVDAPAASESASGEAPMERPRPVPAPEPTYYPAPAARVPAPVSQVPSVTPPPAGAPAAPASVPAGAVATAPPAIDAAPPPPPPVDPPRTSEPVRFDEITIPEDSVIGIRLDTLVSSETARLEDRVVARVTRDVQVDGRTAIPAGARLEGVVSLVEPGGKFKERARVGIRFTRLILDETSRIPIQTDAIYRGGDSPAPEATAKIGAGAAIGAMLGAVIGGKKGAAIGAGAGAAGGTAIVAKGDRNEAVLAEGSPLTVRLTAPVTVRVERASTAPSTRLP